MISYEITTVPLKCKNDQCLSLCFSNDTPKLIEPTVLIHKESAEKPLEHISNHIAKSNNPIITMNN